MKTETRASYGIPFYMGVTHTQFCTPHESTQHFWPTPSPIGRAAGRAGAGYRSRLALEHRGARSVWAGRRSPASGHEHMASTDGPSVVVPADPRAIAILNGFRMCVSANCVQSLSILF